MRANAIVQPLAVMIELLAAAIARAAVLRSLLHVGLTNVAEKFHVFARVFPDVLKNFSFAS